MPRSRPVVEQLEDRCVPVTWGNPWPDAANLTVSFAPDGTVVGDRTSGLFAALDAVAPRDFWQREVLRALQTWAVHSNINIGLVADQGLAFGTPGRPQGDSRFGDIRIAGYDIASDVLAIATPYEATAGTWAGDIKLNTAYHFGTGGAGDIDLYTALLHEAAHVFGLDHSDDPESAVYAHYLGRRLTGLTSEDISRLQELYGARTADRFEGSLGNETLARATQLSLIENTDGALGVAVSGDIGSLSDVDVFTFRAPLTLGGFGVRLDVEGFSLLNARLTVYDAAGRAIASASARDPLDNDLVVYVPKFTPLATYYVKVEGAADDVFGIGSYNLQIQAMPLLKSVTDFLAATADDAKGLLNNDLHTDDSMATASLLPPLLTQTPSRFEYAFKASISDRWDVDFYRIRAPQSADMKSLAVMVWGTDHGGLLPQVTIYNSLGAQLSAEVLVNENGVFIVQIANPTPGADYFIQVHAADPAGANNTGNYFLGVDFSTQTVQLNTVTTGTLSAADPQDSGAFIVNQSHLFHFTLSAAAADGSRSLVTFTIRDANGNVVSRVTAVSGQPAVSGSVYLARGIYTFHFEGRSADGTPLPPTTYLLKGSRLSDPIGPQPEDPTQDPSGTTTQSPSSSTPPPDNGSSSSPPPKDPTYPPPEEEKTYTYSDYWYYYDGGDNRGLNEDDPYSDPYQTY